MLFQRTLTCAAVCAVSLLADTVVLKSGRTIDGTYLGGDSRTVRIAAGDRVESVPVADITEIRFGPGHSASSASSSSTSASRNSLAPASSGRVAQATSGLEIPAGTAFVIRMIDDVDSERDSTGKTYRASVDESVMVDGQVAIPKGADVVVKLVDDQQSGKLTGRTVLTLDVQSVNVNGRDVEMHTAEVTQQSGSQGASTAKRTAGIGAVGAIIGGIAGGGKGAAIGAASGAAVGAGSQVLTKGQRVRVPSETRMTFTLDKPVRI